ncbi:hypothetical protein [Parasulfitobacter algicola]|uniref:Uncharacterized protein n=1 Tax=Parasulfitobacter algicola TaxID=2614809 RepID=A0ABX2IPJ7_9RHOB|nr:hypothetical protein [Sulfitobacter algicola]NSX54809.1 hypothetical protein [Sulfitobacter algicola]
MSQCTKIDGKGKGLSQKAELCVVSQMILLARSNRECSNSSVPDFHASASAEPLLSPDQCDELFEELERWHDVLKPHADELRGPRP